MNTSIKKLLALCLIISFFTSLLPAFFAQAQDQEGEGFYFRVDAASTTRPDAKRAEDETPIKVINRSDKDYFVPNKTLAEFNSFRNNAPRYVSVAECGDGVCSEGEDIYNCPKGDCKAFSAAEGCGDGVCDQSIRIFEPNPPVTDNAGVCDPDHAGFIAVGIWNTLLGAITGCFIGGPVGCIIGAAVTAIPSTALIIATKCEKVNGVNKIKEIKIPTGEVYATSTTAEEYGVFQTVCKADCAPPSVYGCGVCGFNSQGQQCPNWCNGGGYNQENCVYRYPTTVNSYESIAFDNKNILKKYLTASEASAILEVGSTESISTQPYNYRDEGGYSCYYGGNTDNLCPAGRYCEITKGLKPGTSLTSYLSPNSLNETTAPFCPAGTFCPVGSQYPRYCPPNTYSTGSAEKCTQCPKGTSTGGAVGSPSASYCVNVFFANDTRCNYDKENPINSPYDCPDERSKESGSPQLAWYGDGRCTGVESISSSSPFYSPDCFCGNDTCDADENYSSCYYDCYCRDTICGNLRLVELGSGHNPYETNTCKYRGGVVVNESDCRHMNSGENCGNGVCEPGEMYKSSIGRIVCPRDCSCGNGYCDTSKGEFYSATSAAGSCNADCQCGNGICNSGDPYKETAYSCIEDCHCGNNICENNYFENAINCSSDCKCGDNICSTGETSGTCSDCSSSCNNNGNCDIGETYDCIDCRAMNPY